MERKDYERKWYARKEEIFSKVLRAGRRTYFFDVRATKADDYYITLQRVKNSLKKTDRFTSKKHKIYLYKEDFSAFAEILVIWLLMF
jgi:hypothetical protein